MVSHSPPGAPYAEKNHLFGRQQAVRLHPVVRLPASSAPPTAHAVLLTSFSILSGIPPQDVFRLEQLAMLTDISETPGGVASSCDLDPTRPVRDVQVAV